MPALGCRLGEFDTALQGIHQADHLDRLLSQGKDPPIIPVDLNLKNRRVASEADVEALLAEIRDKLIAQLRAGTRVRIA